MQHFWLSFSLLEESPSSQKHSVTTVTGTLILFFFFFLKNLKVQFPKSHIQIQVTHTHTHPLTHTTGLTSHLDTLIHFTVGHPVTPCFGVYSMCALAKEKENEKVSECVSVCLCVFVSHQCHSNRGDPRPSWQGSEIALGTCESGSI